MRGGPFALFLGVTTVYARFSVMLTGFLTAFITFIYKPGVLTRGWRKKRQHSPSGRAA
nr:hypothetical protein [uncultured bacterium]